MLKKGFNILLVEDEPDHVRLIKKALMEKEYFSNQLFWMKDGKEATDFAKHNGKYHERNAPIPDLILLDVKLPMKNGFEVLGEMRSITKYMTVPIIMLTTTSYSENITKAMKLGANDFVVKPVVYSEFAKKIRGIVYYWLNISNLSAGGNK